MIQNPISNFNPMIDPHCLENICRQRLALPCGILDDIKVGT